MLSEFNSRIRPLIVIGTRPEAIKLAPLVRVLSGRDDMEPIVCLSGQHGDLAEEVLGYFDVPVDVRLNIENSEEPARFFARGLDALSQFYARARPQCVVAQGDTTTTLAAAMSAFYAKLPFVYVESGLRTDRLDQPWPEEYHRRVAAIGAALHCAPSEVAAEQLKREGVAPSTIRVTGNPVIDALMWAAQKEAERSHCWLEKYHQLAGRELVLVTTHRRESIGEQLDQVYAGLAQVARQFPEVIFLVVVHPNPQVARQVRRADLPVNVRRIEPVPYPEFVWLMNRSKLIVTDSGGIQEEAPSVGKPLVVVREVTERHEVVEMGGAILAGTRQSDVAAAVARLLTGVDLDPPSQARRNPYGDGRAAGRIADGIAELCCDRPSSVPLPRGVRPASGNRNPLAAQ